MEKLYILTIIGAALTVFTFPGVSSEKCWLCSTDYTPNCGNPFKEVQGKTVLDGQSVELFQKIECADRCIRVIIDRGHGQLTIHRGCAPSTSELDGCHPDSLSDSHTRCICRGHLCNGGETHLTVSTFQILCMIAIRLISKIMIKLQ